MRLASLIIGELKHQARRLWNNQDNELFARPDLGCRGSILKTAIGLLTDFGASDPFVGEMKAVIFSICPDAEIIDITHEVEHFNIRMGAFLLASSAPHFPPGTVHVAVVDPGVGSDRRPITVQTSRALYVGPDNGLLIPAATREGIQHVFELTNRSLMRDAISSTFHGRDIFAPVAAHLAAGIPPSQVGPEITSFTELSFGEGKFDEHGVTCEILHVDKFGNVVTNISRSDAERLHSRLNISVRGRKFSARLVKSYSEIGEKELGFLIGSHGFLELACRQNSAAKRVKARPGDVLRMG
jgi:S-adenosylmethionine hydrolase